MSAPRVFKDRLHLAMAGGNLTMMDLARWFERPHPTVRQWCRGVTMSGPPQDQEMILALLTRLEIAIRYKKGFPVPRLRPRDRRAYLLKMKGRALASKLK